MLFNARGVPLPGHPQPDLQGQPLGVEEGAVGVKDGPRQTQCGHTFPMSVRKCMSWKEMGLQAA